jgi:Tfp pilus assembly protein PilN
MLMKNISILPVEYRQRQKRHQRTSIIIIIAIALFVVYSISFITLFVAGIGYQSELQGLKKENLLVQKQIDELKAYETALQKILSTAALIKQAAGTNPRWENIINDACADMPVTIWLSDLSCSYSENAGEIKIKGSAFNHNDVADWLDKLKDVQGISSVSCKVSSGEASTEGQTVQFEINAAVSPGEAWTSEIEGVVQP